MSDIFGWLCTFCTEIKRPDFGFFCFDIDFHYFLFLDLCCFVQNVLDAPSGGHWRNHCQSGVDDCGPIGQRKQIGTPSGGPNHKFTRALLLTRISRAKLTKSKNQTNYRETKVMAKCVHKRKVILLPKYMGASQKHNFLPVLFIKEF